MNKPKSLDEYIAMGAVDIVGVDKDGELVFAMSEKAKEIAPELWKVHEEYVSSMIIDLFEKDLITITYNENLEAFVQLSDQGKELLKEMGLIPLEDN